MKKLRRGPSPGDAPLLWPSEEGIHALVPGEPPSAGELAALSAAYQKRIRESPVWDTMVKEFGERKAAEMLREFAKTYYLRQFDGLVIPGITA